MLFWIRILSCLPLRVLYVLSDCLLYPVIYHVVRYRRTVVAKNLRMSFPEKSLRERKEIERRFYHHFADVIVEIIYGYRISDEEMERRFVFEGVEEAQAVLRKTGGVFFMMGHLGNWEWTADMAKRYTDRDIIHYNVYRRLKDSKTDAAMLVLRAKRGGNGCIEKNMLLRHLVSLRHENKPISIGIVSDQKPSPRNAHIWTTFLHQDTAFLDGTEVLSRKFGYGVAYMHVTSIKRGYYRGRVEIITDDPTHTEEQEITLSFAHKLENNILEQPEQWLWSHNRWKWSR